MDGCSRQNPAYRLLRKRPQTIRALSNVGGETTAKVLSARTIGPSDIFRRVLYFALAFWIMLGGGVFLVGPAAGPAGRAGSCTRSARSRTGCGCSARRRVRLRTRRPDRGRDRERPGQGRRGPAGHQAHRERGRRAQRFCSRVRADLPHACMPPRPSTMSVRPGSGSGRCPRPPSCSTRSSGPHRGNGDMPAGIYTVSRPSSRSSSDFAGQPSPRRGA